jgi:UDP-N-acetylglucosamine 2-epimerase (non-hydrolysing)
MFHKIGIVVGTRPEAIKLIPIYLTLKESKVPVQLVSTGQHQTMLEQIFSFFQIKPDVSLEVMLPNQSLAVLTARLSEKLQMCFEERKYDLIIVQGDTTTAMVASLIAFYNRIKVAHIEAGLRTYNKFSPYPEEINRQLISRIADYHFAPTQRAMAVLEKENLEKAYQVGNTVIDSLLLCIEKVNKQRVYYEAKYNVINNFERLILITGHRRENFGQGFEDICTAIKLLAAQHPSFLFYYPVHLNPNVQDKVQLLLSGLTNVILDHPLPYDELIFLMSRSYILLTDSGGIQEEGSSLNVPILVMRDTTERPEGIEGGCAVLVGTSVQKILTEFNRLVTDKALYTQMAIAPNPYGDGNAASYIVAHLLEEAIG